MEGREVASGRRSEAHDWSQHPGASAQTRGFKGSAQRCSERPSNLLRSSFLKAELKFAVPPDPPLVEGAWGLRLSQEPPVVAGKVMKQSVYCGLGVSLRHSALPPPPGAGLSIVPGDFKMSEAFGEIVNKLQAILA